MFAGAPVLSVLSGAAFFGSLVSGAVFASKTKEHVVGLIMGDELLGAGSVATVRRGKYRGEDVAVKMLRPGIRQLIEADLSLLSAVVSVLSVVVPSTKYLDLNAAVEQFGVEISAQLDLNVEALHLMTFARMFQDDPNVTCPAPITSTRDVLVLPVIEGLALAKWMEVEKDPKERKRVASKYFFLKKKGHLTSFLPSNFFQMLA